MSNNRFMALFGPDTVVASVFSETDSVKYKLVVRGSNSDSRVTDVEVSINDKDIINRASQRARGLNLAVIDATTLTLIEWKNYDMYSLGSNVSAFKQYINGLPPTRIVALYTWDAIKSNDELDEFLVSNMGSLAWRKGEFLNIPSTSKLTPSRSSYCAIYNSKMRKIVSENFVGNSHASLNEDSRSFVEIVFDSLDDVGYTGIPQRIIDDISERTGDGSVYDVYTWPSQLLVGSDVYPGDLLRLTGDLFQDQVLTDANGYAALSVYAKDSSGKILEEKRIDSRGRIDKYTSKETYFEIPAGAATINCTFYHFPSTVKTGTAMVKNVVLTKVSRLPRETGTAAIGVNGFRVASMHETDAEGNDNPIDQLLKLPVDVKGKEPSKTYLAAGFAEMETLLSDSGTYESGTTTTAYEFKNWGTANSTIDSLNLKPGDKVIVSCELARDALAITNGKWGHIVIRFGDANGNFIFGDGAEGDTAIPGVYEFRKKEVIVPADAVVARFYCARAPVAKTATGNIMVRNIRYQVNRGA